VLVDFDNVGEETLVGKPDGCCLDADGNLWVACFGGGCVIQFDTKTAKELRRIRIPGAKQITSCCFGGEDYSDLYVTSAKSRLTDEEEILQPLAGSLYRVTKLHVKGTKPFEYQGC
jgi:gluconolactonase